MYLSFFGMEFNPFDKSIDTKHAFETEDFKIMKNRLEFLKDNKGLALITGVSGVGKTFSIRAFLSSLNPNLFKVIYIPMSTLTVMEFYRQLCLELGLETERKKIDMFREIQNHIMHLVKDKKINVIICIDEAQYLKTDIINDLKILLNFEMDSKNYFSLILMGQPILNSTLNRNVHESIRQRISISYNFVGISKEELINYIESRCKVANITPSIFSDNAYETIYSSCSGSIRVVNNIISKCLLIACKKEKNIIDSEIVIEAYNDLLLG